jgi:UDP-2-acetamido-2,6-beta-L-arabino-hexul-4-ose reductase
MKILITGAKGFMGKNLITAMKNMRDGKDKTAPLPPYLELYEYDIDTDPAL